MELYIPANAKTQTEIFNGFGKKELQKSIIGIIFGIFMAMIGYLITAEIAVLIIIMLVMVFISIMMCAKIENLNQSVVDIVLDIIHFSKSQKIYPYRYLDEWGE